MTVRFDFLSGRLTFIKVFKTDNPMENFGFYQCVSFFETHVFGVISQYERIRDNIPVVSKEGISKGVNTHQQQLDIYYYILTWNKIKGIFEKIKQLMNRVKKERDDIKPDFKEEYKLWRNRMERFLREFDDSVRNTYEHPKFEPMVCGNIIMWGNTIIDGEGNIKSHVEGNVFSEVRKTHIEKLNSLRIDFIDLILKYFSDKYSSTDLLRLRKDIEENIDKYVSEYKKLRQEGNSHESIQVFHGLIRYDMFLKTEGIPLSEEVTKKIHSMILS